MQGRRLTSGAILCRYARSIVSRVDHARELQQSLAPEEQPDWTCVWEAGRGSSWESYIKTALAGTYRRPYTSHYQGVTPGRVTTMNMAWTKVVQCCQCEESFNTPSPWASKHCSGPEGSQCQ